MSPIPSRHCSQRFFGMFPRSFRAQVGQRMAIWAGMLGFLFSLYATVEIIQTVRISHFSGQIAATAAALKAHNTSYNAYSQLARGLEPDKAGQAVLTSLAEIRRAAKDDGITKASADMAKAVTALVPLALNHPERPKALQELVLKNKKKEEETKKKIKDTKKNKKIK